MRMSAVESAVGRWIDKIIGSGRQVVMVMALAPTHNPTYCDNQRLNGEARFANSNHSEVKCCVVCAGYHR